MPSDPHVFDELKLPFIFVPHGEPEPTEWLASHPNHIKLPATFVPRAGGDGGTDPSSGSPPPGQRCTIDGLAPPPDPAAPWRTTENAVPNATQAGTNEGSDRTLIGADPVAAYCRANEALATAASRHVSEPTAASNPPADVGSAPADRAAPSNSLVEQVWSAMLHAIIPPAEAKEPLPDQAEVPAVPDASVPVVLSNGTVVQNPLTGGPLLQPAGVSLAQNAQIGRAISLLRSGFSLPGTPMREAAMAELFLPGQPMDYQRIYSKDGLINRTYIAFGNYNFGVVAAAAGYTKEEALLGAGAANLLGRGDKSGALFNNPINVPFISAGYDAYKAGMIGGPLR